jgi:hypothetical protein
MTRTLVVLILLWLIIPAFAHNDADWIAKGGYTNKIGGSCCGERDCEIVRNVTAEPGGYRVHHRTWSYSLGPSGTPYERDIDEVVPYSETQRSEDGKFWRCKFPDGERRCFFAPDPMTH